MDSAAVGAVGVPFVLDVERGKIREFARATLSSNAAYFGEQPVSPPTFLTTILFWETYVDGSNPWHRVKIDPARGMHAEQEFIFHGPPARAGTRLECVSRIESVYSKEGRRGGRLEFAVMRTEFRDGSGRLVAEAVLTGVETARPPERAAP